MSRRRRRPARLLRVHSLAQARRQTAVLGAPVSAGRPAARPASGPRMGRRRAGRLGPRQRTGAAWGARTWRRAALPRSRPSLRVPTRARRRMSWATLTAVRARPAAGAPGRSARPAARPCAWASPAAAGRWQRRHTRRSPLPALPQVPLRGQNQATDPAGSRRGSARGCVHRALSTSCCHSSVLSSCTPWLLLLSPRAGKCSLLASMRRRWLVPPPILAELVKSLRRNPACFPACTEAR